MMVSGAYQMMMQRISLSGINMPNYIKKNNEVLNFIPEQNPLLTTNPPLGRVSCIRQNIVKCYCACTNVYGTNNGLAVLVPNDVGAWLNVKL